MKSFLIKDFILLKQRKSFFMVYFLMIVAMIYTKNIVFFIDYFSILAMILAFSTMSYDSHDNGMVFLMTMPNARKNYARAKYALCGILLLASWVVPYLVKVVSSIKEYNMINIADILLDSIIIIPICILICSVMIPVMLKFGAEKGRLVLALGFGTLTIIAVVIMKTEILSNLFGLAILEVGNLFGFEILGIAACVVILIGLVVSIIISDKIMEKREF
ncbi:MAG: ABC-2 transporter permease [Butyrivibrio sp.]|nr:ABC-2 transporter permease [Butyrivibrio sp.]